MCKEGRGEVRADRSRRLRTHLSEEGDGLLFQLLRVSNVAADDLVEPELLCSLWGRALLPELLCPYRDLTPDRVLCSEDRRVDGVVGEDSL